MDLIQELNKERLANEVTPVKVGDTVRVHVKVKEGSRERIQVFEGTVIAKKHSTTVTSACTHSYSQRKGTSSLLSRFPPCMNPPPPTPRARYEPA